MSEWLIDQPIEIGGRSLRSRVYLPAHQPGLAEDGRVSDRYVAYHARRARSGVAMQVTGATPILPSTQWNDICLWNIDDSVVPGYQRLAAAVHDEGGTMLAQLAHPGPTEYEGGHVVGPSWDFSEVCQQIAVPATVEEIDAMVRLYADATARCAAGELDGVEISMAHGLLLAAFLSPLTNRREDEYGGSVANRLRFPLAVLEACREALGPDRLLGVRLGIDDMVAGGITPESAVELAQALAPACDYISVMVGNNNRMEPRVQHWPPTPAPFGLFRDSARMITEAVDVPVCAVGRVTTAELANDMLVAGDADMVGIVRGHIADPDLLVKSREGRQSDVRPCVGANVCVNSLLAGIPLTCMVNPDVGDGTEPEPMTAASGHRVVVVGAGPSGCEAARRLAIAGCEVTLLERDHRLGGQVADWSQAPSRQEYAAWFSWFERQLAQLGVDVRLDTAADADTVSALQPEAVVLATGSRPHTCPLTQEDGSVRHLDTITALRTTDHLPGPVVVADRIGFLDAVLVAEHFAAGGHDVTLVTSRLHAGEGEGITTLYTMLRTLNEAGVTVMERREVDAATEGQVHLRGVFGEPAMTLPAATLVSYAGGEPDLDLLQPLQAAGLTVHQIGDAFRPRRVEHAVADAREVADRILAGLSAR